MIRALALIALSGLPAAAASRAVRPGRALPSVPALALPAALSRPPAVPSAAIPEAFAGAKAARVAVPAGAAAPAPAAGSPRARSAAPAPRETAALPGALALAESASGRAPAAALAAAFDGLQGKAALARPVLAEIESSDTGKYEGKKGRRRAEKKFERELARIQELQRRLYAEKKRSVLIVLQAMDTAGKDGTIRYVLSSADPQGLAVHSFKKPTAEEAAHDFLWRIRPKVPGPGMIGVFNRSHYEDILVPTVERTHPAAEIESRYARINAFERELAEKGVLILKFYLHISKDEQRARLQERLDKPEKNWKFDPNDLAVRRKWDRYMGVYRELFARTSTPWAPWRVIPADSKWYRNLKVARALRKALERLDPRYPPAPELKGVSIPD